MISDGIYFISLLGCVALTLIRDLFFKYIGRIFWHTYDDNWTSVLFTHNQKGEDEKHELTLLYLTCSKLTCIHAA